jgi:hyperosmotically inducible periplasmic protein
MKAAIGSVVIVAAVLVGGPVPMHAAPQTATSTPADSTVDKRIAKRIADSPLKKYDIKVHVDKGVATLTGTVATEADRRLATQLATMPDIERVDNQLVVDLDAGRTARGTTGKVDKAAEKTKEGVGKAVDKSAAGISKATEKTKEGTATAADKSAQGVGKAGEAITDTWIKTRVKSKFVGEDLLKNSDITVDVADHVVTLTGTVTSAAGRARAIEEAKAVDGVHQVVDKLTIGQKK